MTEQDRVLLPGFFRREWTIKRFRDVAIVLPAVFLAVTAAGCKARGASTSPGPVAESAVSAEEGQALEAARHFFAALRQKEYEKAAGYCFEGSRAWTISFAKEWDEKHPTHFAAIPAKPRFKYTNVLNRAGGEVEIVGWCVTSAGEKVGFSVRVHEGKVLGLIVSRP